MATQPVPGMPAFNARVEEFRIWQPQTYERNLHGATMGSVDDSYLYLICAYDYVFNPGDLKMWGILKLFLTKDSERGFETDTYWSLNMGGNDFQSIRNLVFGGPIPGAPGNSSGGVRTLGAANYNLFTKAIEIGCRALLHHSHRDSMAQAIKTYRDRPITAAARGTLVSRYNQLTPYYTPETLTRFGLIYR